MVEKTVAAKSPPTGKRLLIYCSYIAPTLRLVSREEEVAYTYTCQIRPEFLSHSK